MLNTAQPRETAPRKREEWTWLDNHGIDRGFGCY